MASKRKISLQSPSSAASSREAILLAALKAFARYGFDGASMPKIAKLADVAPTLIHYYFGSKEKLWRESVDHSLGELRREAKTISSATVGLAPLDRLRVLLQAYCLFAARFPDHFVMIIAEARADSSRFEWVQANYTGTLFDEVVSLLREADKAGTIRKVMVDQVALSLVAGILVNFTVYPSDQTSEKIEASAKAWCDQMFDILLNGIAAA